MTVQKDQKFTGGRSLTEKGGLDLDLQDVADDITELRTQLIALLAKLDADAGVTDVNYASTLTPATQKTTKG